MKQNTLSFAVAAAGAHQVAATFGEIAGLINGVAGVGANVAANVGANIGVGAGLGGGVGAGASFNFDMGFSTAKSFNCPLNVVNKCTPEQEKGWDFSGLKKGSFDSYLGFQFGGGWTCEDSASKRGMLSGRTFGEIEKVISGICPLGGALNMGVGAQAGVDLFSISSFDISTEFDARLEFHYDMPDGSVCKHFSDCKQGGSTIVNNQCGGAKKVHIIYPKTSTNVKKSCKISCHKIKWHCGPPQVQPSLPATTISPPASQTTPNVPGTTDTKPAQQTTSSVPGTTSTQPGQQTTPSVPGTTDTQPGQQTTPTVPGTTDTQPGQQTTPTVPGTTDTQPGQQTTPNVPGTTAPPAGSTSNAVCTGTTTTTSIPNCGPSMPECAGKTGAQVVTVVVPMTGSDCAPNTPGYPANPQTDNSAKPTGEVPQTTGVTPGTPTQAPPCPPVVPRCLNTFLDLKAKCKDNKDAGCYCPNKDFVNVIFNCIYAHGDNDNIISEAISFFQGMCAPYIPQNPAIATGCQPIIEIITVTGTPRITDVPYTKIVYTGTNGDHQTVPVEVTVPNIAMPTAPAGQPGVSGAQPTAPGAQPTAPAGGACTPGTDACPPAAPGTPGAQPTAPAGGACTPGTESCPPAAPGTPGTPGAPGVEPVGPPAASGTGMVPTGPSGIPVTAGVGRVGAGMMIAAAAFLAAL